MIMIKRLPVKWVPCNRGCGNIVAVDPECACGGVTCDACDAAWVPPWQRDGAHPQPKPKPVLVVDRRRRSWIDNYYGN